MPGRPRPPRPPRAAVGRVPSGPGEKDGPAEGDQDRPVPFLVTERHGSVASIPLDAVAGVSADLAPLVGLHPGAARAALRKAVLATQNGASR